MAEEAEWDTSKENFVPVRQGRATSALVTPVSVQKRDKELQDAKRAFLEDIQAASDDPLPAWLKFIKWTQEQYSTQASRRELTQALEAATKALSSLQRYRDDVRLLRIWVQYADCLPDPSSVFLFLEDHNIGRDHALFYEAYAAYLELKGNFSQADLVYQEGVKRLAKPLERLKQKHAAFNQRMAKRRERQESEAAIGMGPAADTTSARSTLAPLVPIDSTPQLDENGRPLPQARLGLGRNTIPPQQPAASVALGVRPAALPPVSSRSRGASGSEAASLWAPASSGGAATQQRGNALLLSSLGVPGAGSSSSSSIAAPRQLAIHVDEEFGPSGRGPIPTAFPPSLQQHALLPGMAMATKENSSQPAVWAGTKLKQQGVFAPGPASNKLEVFEDEDSEEGCEGSAPDASAAGDQQRPAGLRQRLDAPLAPAAAAAPVVLAALASSTVASTGACAPDSSLAAAPAAVSRKQQLLQAPASTAAAAAAAAPAAPAQQQQHGSRKPSAQGPVAVPAAAAGGPPQGFDEALLVGPGGEELSFEEVRAAAWRKAHAAKQPPPQRHVPRPQQQQQEPQQVTVPAAPAAAASAPAHVSQDRQQRAPLQPSKGVASSASAAAPEPVAALDSRNSTQHKASSGSSSSRRPLGEAALLPVKPDAAGRHVPLGDPGGSHAAAGGPLGADGCRSQGGSSSSSSSGRKQPFASSAARSAAPAAAAAAAAPSAGPPVDDAAGGVTINTRAAFDAMNGMFGGSDDTTTMHGFGGAAAASRRPPAVSAAAAAGADLGGVTMNTRAAFDAMNGMFGGDDTTTMHGFGRAAAAGGAGRAAAGRRSMALGDPGGVTMNTRAAFDAMNGMFGGSDDTTTMHGFGRPAAAAAGARRPVAAGDPGGVTMNTRAAFDAMNVMFGGDDTTTMHGFGRAAAAGGAAAGVEPTVTVNTRAAFDYMNGVFGAAGDVTMNQTAAIGGRKAPRKTSRLAASAAAGGSNGGAAAPLGLYEDTELLNPVHAQAPGPGCADQGPMFGVYEDTEFVGAKMSAAAGRNSRGSGQGSSEGAGSSSFGLYEDTDFITRPVGGSMSGSSGGGGSCRPSRQSMAGAGGGGGGLELYEDTDFITQPASKAGPSGRHSTAGTGGGGLGLYEDTDFITKHVGGSRHTHRQSGAAAAGAGGGGLGLYEDTEFISQPHASSSGGGNAGSSHTGGNNQLSLYEDTEFLDAAAAARCPAASGPGNGGQGAGLGLYEDTEFITGSAAAAAASGGSGGSGSGSLLLTKLNRLSLANGALYKGQQGGMQGSHDDENAAPNAAPSSSLGLYEDTEFIGDAGRPSSLRSGTGAGGLEVYADTEFLTKPVAGTAVHADPGQRGSSSRQHRQQHQQQQLQQEDPRAQGTSGRSHGLAAAPLSPQHAAVGPCGSSSGVGSILQQGQHHGYAGAGPSRFGPGSVPNSPVAASRPGSAKSTPGRPPRTPGTPGAGLGPMARHMESFEVMESPAVHEALAGRPPCPVTASSPAGSFASSPGFGARENSLPGGHLLPDGKEGQRLQPRSLADRSTRAAALQPLSTSRAELLGVQVDPHALVEGDEDEEWGQQQQEERQKGMARQSPGRALRSLQFGRGSGIGAPSDR